MTDGYASQLPIAATAEAGPEVTDALLLRNLSHLPRNKWTTRWLDDRLRAPQCVLSGFCRCDGFMSRASLKSSQADWTLKRIRQCVKTCACSAAQVDDADIYTCIFACHESDTACTVHRAGPVQPGSGTAGHMPLVTCRR